MDRTVTYLAGSYQFQPRDSDVRVLTPSRVDEERDYPFLYLLLVEPDRSYEIRKSSAGPRRGTLR